MANRSFWIGLFVGLVAAALLGLFVLPFLGVFDATAVGGPGFLNWWGEQNMESNIRWHAPDAKIPTQADVDEGLHHYAATCRECHGAPGVSGEEWARKMLPAPPKLWEKETQEMSDGELYYAVANGLSSTGMPAFGTTHKSDELWNIVALVRHLNSLSDEQQKELQEQPEEHHH